MTTTIRVTRGLCSPMRDDVLTAIKPFGVKVLAFDCWGEGRYPFPNKLFALPMWVRIPDADIWARRHVATITVSDEQAKWAERLLWQSGKVRLESRPLNPKLKWNAPPECKVSEHGTLGRGHMPTPWSEKKRQPRAAKPKKAARQTRRSSILDFLRRI